MESEEYASDRMGLSVITIMIELAGVLQHQGRVQETEDLELRIKQMIEKNPFKHILIQQLAALYVNQGREEEAVELQSLAVQTIMGKLEPESYFTLESMGALALIYERFGHWNRAVEMRKQVMEGMKRTLGTDNQLTLLSMKSLIRAYDGQGRWNEAEDLCVELVETNKRVFGTQHPDTLYSVISLALKYWHRHQ